MSSLFWVLLSIMAPVFGSLAIDAVRASSLDPALSHPLIWLMALAMAAVFFYGLLIRPVRGIIAQRRNGCTRLEALGPHGWELGLFLAVLAIFIQAPFGVGYDQALTLPGLVLVVGLLISFCGGFRAHNDRIFDRQMRRFAERFWRYSPRPPHQDPPDSSESGPEKPRWTFEPGQADQWKK